MALSNLPIIALDSIDSTNNYAMQLIDADKAQHGLTITTRQQTAGKGQRGRQWQDIPGESLLMSIITVPSVRIDKQFAYNASIAVAIAEVLEEIYKNWSIRIKWPNDIIINDKKAGGLLIENIIRGGRWIYSVIGFGLNVLQKEFHQDLPFATSLKIAGGEDFDIDMLRDRLRERILDYTSGQIDTHILLQRYNELLYQKGNRQKFTDGAHEWQAIIKSTNEDGTLRVQLADGSITHYKHGLYTWVWE